MFTDSQLYNRLYEHNRLYTGWMNYANELSQAALERSSQDAYLTSYDVIWLTRSKAAVWTVDNVVHLIEIKKKNSSFFIYFLSSVAYDPERVTKIRSKMTKLYKTLLH